MQEQLIGNSPQQGTDLINYPQYEHLVPQQDGQMKMVDWNLQNINTNFTVMGYYDGPTNDQGLGQGQGSISYSNGNRYIGQFSNGMKHGQGTMYYYEGSKFEGNYSNDFRQGQGKLYLSNGSIIETTWVNDMMNGDGTYTNRSGKQKKCIFFNNTKIELDKDSQDDLCQDCAIFSMIWSIAFYGLLVAGIAGGQGICLGIAGFFYLVNLIWGFCCTRTCSYIFNIKKLSNLREYLCKLKQEHPQIKFHIECYHYETRVTHERDGKTETTQRRVTTLHKTKWFRYDMWCDRSQDIYALDYLQTIPYARLHIDKSIDYSDRAANSLLCQKSILKSRYRYRDDYMDFSQSDYIDGYSEFIFIFNDLSSNKEQKPMASSRLLYVFSTFLCLNFINRIAFINSTKRVDWELNKYIIS